jgi:hypothetical protein
MTYQRINRLRRFIICLLVVVFASESRAQLNKESFYLFDAKTFNGWEGDTVSVWRIINGALVGGDLSKTLPHNEFLATKETFGDFELTLDFKLEGTGFVNAGVQFHSERLQDPAYEMQGYQADLGDGYWASLYDESRRDLTIVRPDSALVEKVLKRGSWNKFTIRSVGRRIIIRLNDIQTVDYTEPDTTIKHSGRIALQVHGGGKVQVSYKNIRITKL